jgi:hypothetical protein
MCENIKRIKCFEVELQKLWWWHNTDQTICVRGKTVTNHELGGKTVIYRTKYSSVTFTQHLRRRASGSKSH